MRVMRARYGRTLHARVRAEQFAQIAKNVDGIFQQAVTGMPVPGRLDLWCPFGDEYNCQDWIKQRAVDREREMAQKQALADSLMAKERQGLAAGKKAVPFMRASGSKVVDLDSRRPGSKGKALSKSSSLAQNTARHLKILRGLDPDGDR